MDHNVQLHLYGRCACLCHSHRTVCNCGWAAEFDVPLITRRRVRSEKLDSRVRAFSKAKNRSPGHAIAVTKAHFFHEVTPR